MNTEEKLHELGKPGVYPFHALKFILISIVLSALVWLQLFHKVTERDLWSSHEARAGLNARYIIESGNWYLPGRNQDLPDVQKPPAYYWAVAFFGNLSGEVNELAIRLPSLFAGVICIGLVVLLGKELGNLRAGVTGAFVLVTAGHFAWAARIGRIDMPLAAVVIAVGYFQLRLLKGQGTAALIGLGTILALGILFKGPIALVLSGITVISMGIWARVVHRGKISVLLVQNTLGFLFCCLLCAPWFYCAHLATAGQFSQQFFIEHNWDRGMGTGRLRSHPFYFYGPQFFIDFLPWSVILVLVLAIIFLKNKYNLVYIMKDSGFVMLCLMWFFAIFFVLSISHYKRADYLLPAYPVAALGIGWLIAFKNFSFMNVKMEQYQSYVFYLGILAGILGMGYLVEFEIPRLEPTRLSKDWANQIQSRIPQGDPLVFFAEEAHAVAFHLDREHKVIGKPEELARLFKKNHRIWVITNPDVLKIWPNGPPMVRWEIVSKNWESNDLTHKPLLLLETKAVSEIFVKGKDQIGSDRNQFP